MSMMPVISAFVEIVSNNYLKLDAQSSQRVSQLTGRFIEIRVKPLPTFYFHVNEQQLDVLSGYEGAVDSCLETSLLSLKKLRDPNQLPALIKSGDVELTGDIRLMQQFAALFSEVEVDIEEKMAKVIGDVAAHLLVRQFVHLMHTFKTVATKSEQWASDVTIEEWRLAPGQLEYAHFTDEVRSLSSSVNSLSKRLAKFEALYGN